jgi:hypothetical protein
VKAFEDISMKRPEGCSKLEIFMRDKFNVRCKVCIVKSAAEYKFYGFRAFPANLQSGDITNCIIELDDKICNDYSKKVNPKDIAVLFLYFIETNMANETLIKRIEMLQKEIFCEGKVDNSLIEFLYGTKKDIVATRLTEIALLYRYFWVDFKTQLKNDSMLIRYLEGSYRAALNKLMAAYGTYGLINRKLEEFDSGAKSILYWIFESANDLRYSMFRFRKNLQQHILGCTSPYARKIMISIYQDMESKVTHVFAEENAMANLLLQKEKTPQQIAVEEANLQYNWKKRYAIAVENASFKYIDDKGFAKLVDQRELDEIRVGIQDIDSVEDKIFLLERLHEQLGRLDNALSMLEDRQRAHKVRQTKGELLKKKDEIELIRQMIFKAPVGKMRYGLYIKYPQGYEG